MCGSVLYLYCLLQLLVIVYMHSVNISEQVNSKRNEEYLLTPSIDMQNLLSLMQSNLFIFALVPCAFWVISRKNHFPDNVMQPFFMVSSSSFTVC
jgi:hypothetical protein